MVTDYIHNRSDSELASLALELVRWREGEALPGDGAFRTAINNVVGYVGSLTWSAKVRIVREAVLYEIAERFIKRILVGVQ